MKIQAVIDEILDNWVGKRLEQTVDHIKAGGGNDEVAGIVTTFTASMNVLREAVEKRANFIITHEPTFYNHWDDVSAVQDDPVYKG